MWGRASALRVGFRPTQPHYNADAADGRNGSYFELDFFFDEAFFFVDDFFLVADFLLALFFFGILAPDFRASFSAMATACFRLFTFFPLPDFSLPSLCSFITRWTFRAPLVDFLRVATILLSVRSQTAIGVPVYSTVANLLLTLRLGNVPRKCLMYKFSQFALITAFSAVGLLAADLPAAHDQTFVNGAAQGGQAEVTLGRLASQKATNQKVKDFGQRMVTDHGKAGQELTSIAEKKSITPPSSMTSEDQALYKKLQGMSGSEFDKTYMEAMVKDHKKDIDEFQREADSGKDPDVKSFASQTLPTLRDHLKMAQDAASAVGASQQ